MRAFLISAGLAVPVALALAFAATAAFAQDEDDPLAELAALGDAMADTGPEGGGSIRAKREVDPEIAKRKKDNRNVECKVDEIKTGKFPNVAVKITVLKAAKEGAGKKVNRNDTLVVVPNLKIDAGNVAMADPATRLNAGAFYLQVGDKVLVRLGENTKGKLWKAEYIERK